MLEYFIKSEDIIKPNNYDGKVLTTMEAFNTLCEKNNELWKIVEDFEKRIKSLEEKLNS